MASRPIGWVLLQYPMNLSSYLMGSLLLLSMSTCGESPDVDQDGDGYSEQDGDCNDLDPNLSPEDGDDDGYSSCAGDCDDSDPSLSPADADGDGFSTCAGDADDHDIRFSPLAEDGPMADYNGDGVFDPVTLDSAEYVFLGEKPDARLPQALASAGDVDGDGLSDLLLSTRSGDSADGGANAGKVYLFLGASLGLEPMLDVAKSDYQFIGEWGGDSAGWSAASAGDVDGDGLDDLVIGARFYGEEGASFGKVYIILGQSLGANAVIDLVDPDYAFVGEDFHDAAGYAVAAAGDVDGDGLGDVLIGALQQDAGGFDRGKAYLITGASLVGQSVSNLSEAPYHFPGEGNNDRAGGAVSSAGDVDGDGRDDLLIGATEGTDRSGDVAGGRVYVVLASSLDGPGEYALAEADFILEGEHTGDYAGVTLASGELDGDGLSDLLIGAPGHDGAGSTAGITYLIRGASLVGSPRRSLASADVVFVGEAANHYSGHSVACAGDVDGDGLADILIGAPVSPTLMELPGQAYLFLGAGLIGAETLSLSQADFKFVGSASGDDAGDVVAGAGDVNGDGADDVLIAAPLNDGAGDDAGAAYLILSGL